MTHAAHAAVVLCECFARDGLQHESAVLPTDVKVALIDRFSAMGFQRIEATSFTHPGNLPQFSDADEVLRRIRRTAGTRYKATCVNMRSIERALAAANAGVGPDEISTVLVATDALSALQGGFVSPVRSPAPWAATMKAVSTRAR
jgi:hydroxymethylglutaryl-CoA lyase